MLLGEHRQSGDPDEAKKPCRSITPFGVGSEAHSQDLARADDLERLVQARHQGAEILDVVARSDQHYDGQRGAAEILLVLDALVHGH